MLKVRTVRELEDELLAPYAMKSYNSRGRVHKEKDHPYRSLYQRDRDRIIHSAAFRRLEYKTQVFVNHEGDYYRTRLTHTLEVAQIARTIASALCLNVDLTEAIALAHDLGHTPFGHSGEDALNELMAKEGGFNHNLQGLRVVDLLEERYPDYPGLNLSWEVREGIVKHSSAFDTSFKLKDLAPDEMPTLETQVVDVADEIAYDNHDIDDGITSGLLKEPELAEVPIWNNIYREISKKYGTMDDDKRKYLIIRSLIDMQVTDLITTSLKKLDALKPANHLDVKRIREKIITFSSKIEKQRVPLRKFLISKLYHHYRVVRMSEKAKHFIGELFDVYLSKPKALPVHIQKRIASDGKKRAICDYIAGMTDRYALDEYKKLFDPYEKV
ncbi:MAG: deoxyguanosinetriphosphate triphosphohydrolase [Candidatus Omnitrophota bacterium]|jgi:dGTPase|nr:MAG: deoxyguanosinetriphosphate triphosphohydrolase [Candidatus Omnitrophota bacterium]